MRNARRCAAIPVGIALAVLGFTALLGCGSSDQPSPMDPAPSAAGSTADAEARATAGNRPPVIRRLRLDPSVPRPGEPLVATVSVSDPDEDPIKIGYRWRLDGQWTGTGGKTLHVPDTAKGALIDLEVVVSDGRSQALTAKLSARVTNRPPEMTSVLVEPAEGITATDDITASPRGSDLDGDRLEFEYTWRVNGNVVAEDGPVLSHARFRRGDTIELEVVASDGADESDPLRTPPLEIVNTPPRITSAPEGIDETGAFQYAVQVEDPDGDRKRFKLLKAPTGMSIDFLNGKLSWDPQEKQSGKHAVEIEVDDLAGGKTTQAFDLEVEFEAPTPPAAPAS